MKNLYFFLFTFISFGIFAQETIVRKLTLSNGTTKDVKIYIPKDYKTDTIHKYPIAIVLNDQYLFDLYKGNAKLFANADLAPKQIVVGVPTNLSPNQDVSLVRKNLGFTKNSKVFYNFIKKDLIAYLDANFKTSPFLSVISEGLASNFAFNFLKETKPIFNSYVFINPRLNLPTIAKIKNYDLKRLDKIDNTFFIYLSNSNFNSKETISAFESLKAGLTSFESKNLNLQFDFFDKSPNKLSPISESVSRAFAQKFKLYRNISKEEYDEKIKDLEPLEAIKYLEERYLNLEYLYGTNLKVRLEDFYAIEGIVTEKQGGDYLRVLGDFALIKYPHLPLGDYYMGMFYEIGKDYKRAEEYYKYGYGKMDPSDPNTDKFYQNIDRVSRLLESQPREEPLPDEEPQEENKDEENK